jgi:Flp pilus assembly protein TadG
MREAVMHKYAARKWENLRFILHAAERSRKNQSVVVALKFAAVIIPLCMVSFLPKSFGRE